MLEIEGLKVRYGTTVAVDGVALAVRGGETVALLGPNGAGKTSLVRAASRVVPSSAAMLSFDGKDMRRMPADAVARLGLVQVPEGRHVFPNLTVQENLQVGLSARQRRSPLFTLDDVHDLFPALAQLVKRSGWALSGGEQQMVAIGRALLAAPRLLLLDEPSLGLAPAVADAVFGALAEVSGQVPMLLIEQDTERALQVADRAYVLVKGEVVVDAPVGELADRQALMSSYLGR